jgi:hypothetical protein
LELLLLPEPVFCLSASLWFEDPPGLLVMALPPPVQFAWPEHEEPPFPGGELPPDLLVTALPPPVQLF